LSTMGTVYLQTRQYSGILYAVNGILMGLIVITPLAGFVSPGSAIILGVLAGPLFVTGERFFGRSGWYTDPVGLLPGHLLGGVFGVLMIAFFAQTAFATGSGFPGLPNGLLFGGGGAAFKQLGIEVLGIIVVMAVIFAISFATAWVIQTFAGGIRTDDAAPELIPVSGGDAAV
ncbi:MAG TPA: ammonium transporter, partial [Candidatus Angelobacter sp.]|nr:ammonium transporter [Candidatus Angelobacter sp.]